MIMATPAAAQEAMPVPLTPHPLDQNQDGELSFAFFSFGLAIERDILCVDDASAGVLRVSKIDTETEVFVALGPDWERAALMGATLFGNKAIVEHFEDG